MGGFVLEHALNQDEYYTPDGVTVIKGGLATSAWIPVGTESSLNLGLRAVGGGYWEQWFDTEAEPRRTQIELEANIGLSKGNAFYYVKAAGTGTFKGDVFNKLEDWDYYSLYIGLGFSSQLPRLLAP